MLRRWFTVFMLTTGCAAGEHALPADSTPASTSEPGHETGSHVNPVRATPPTDPGCQGQFLVSLEGPTLTRLEADGSTRALFTLGQAVGLGDNDVVVNQWEMRGSFVALVGFLYAPPAPHRYEYVVLDLDGNVRFHRIQEEPYNPQVYLASDGSLAVTGGQGFVVRADGGVTELGVFRPVVAAQGGYVLVANGEPWRQGAGYGWMHLDTLTFSPLTTSPFEYANFARVGGRVVYPVSHGLALATPSSTEVITVGPETYLAVAATTPDERFALVASTNDGRLFRLDVNAARLDAVSSGGAVGQIWGHWNATLAPDGAVLTMAKLEDGRLQQRRTADLGTTWVDVGEPMTPGPDFGLGSHLVALARGERVLILNLSTGYGDFLDEVQLVSPSAPSQRVTVGGLYINADIHPGAADLSPDGTCAATWVQREGTVFEEDALFELHLVDPTSGTSRVVQTSSRVSQLRFGMGS
ncbi:MAG: hypothetical protein AB2A00_01920 [Myxococcota bacterium]